MIKYKGQVQLKRKTPPEHCRSPWVRKVCERCNDFYWVIPSAADSHKFCSLDCSKAHRDSCWEIIKCKHCSKDVRSPKHQPRMFCDSKCSHAFNRSENSWRWIKERIRKCEVCENNFSIDKGWQRKKRFCSNKCRTAHRRISPRKRDCQIGHVTNYKDGYKQIKVSGRGWVPEHRYLVEQSIGRLLEKTEFIHHRNGDPQDNRIENLQIVSQSEHARLHYEAELIGLRVMTGEIVIAEVKTPGALEVLRRANYPDDSYPRTGIS